ERGRDRGHSTAGHQRRFAVLEGGELLMEGQMVGSVAQPDVAKVVVAGLSAVEEGRGLEHGHRHCSGDPRHRLTCVDQLGVDSMKTGGGHRMLLVALKRGGVATCKPASVSMPH